MWKNKDIKKRAKTSFRANYWVTVLISFILVFLGVIAGSVNIFTGRTSDSLAISQLATTLGTSLTEGMTEEQTGQDVNDTIKEIEEDRKNNPKLSEEEQEEVNQYKAYDISLSNYLENVFTNKKAADAIAQNIVMTFKGTGGHLYNIAFTIEKFIFTHGWAGKLLAVIYFLIILFWSVFVLNILMIGYSRYTLESHTYGRSKIRRVLFMFGSKSFWKAALTMFLKDITCLLIPAIGLLISVILETIPSISASGIGAVLALIPALAGIVIGVILMFVLWPVRFILANNPTINGKAALKLAAAMTKGNKWHLFGYKLSYIPWHLLNLVTLGILDIFFLTPYMYFADAELYLKLRENAMNNNMVDAYRLEDEMLLTPPQGYVDIEREKEEKPLSEKKKALWAYFETKGIVRAGYPDTSPDNPASIGHWFMNRNPERKYSIPNLILMFFIFAGIGWLWEVVLHIFKDGQFINRGVMHGPWLPIYGAGGLLIIILLRKLAKKPALLVIATFVLCGVLEYFTSLFLEIQKGKRWWDYSNCFMNINGRVCLEGLLIFCIAGILFIYIAGPFFDDLLNKFNVQVKLIMGVCLIGIFVIDMIYSHYFPNEGKGITDYKTAPTNQQGKLPDYGENVESYILMPQQWNL